MSRWRSIPVQEWSGETSEVPGEGRAEERHDAVAHHLVDRLPPHPLGVPLDRLLHPERRVAGDKRLLQVAAVVGKDVPFALLQAIAELPEDALRRGLDHLQAAEFVYETGLFPDLEYAFKHALTHEVTYGGLLAYSTKSRNESRYSSGLLAPSRTASRAAPAEQPRLGSPPAAARPPTCAGAARPRARARRR